MDEWIASNDEESWDGREVYKTREEAVKLAPDELELEPGEPFWTGLKEKQRTDNLVTASIAENLAQKVYEDTCEDISAEFCEDWFKLDKKETERLAVLLSEAIQKFLLEAKRHEPTFFRAVNVKEHEAPEETTT